MENIIAEIKRIKVVPVVVIKDIKEASPLMAALIKGDVPLAEITFRTKEAKEAISILTKEYPSALIGAGTVINETQAKEAIEAGAKFIVSPGLSKEVFNVCKEAGVPYLPGVVTPTEIIEALSLGLTNLKFFPAGVFGGLKAIKALSSAFPSVSFMPTGGVDLTNLAEFVKNPKIFAVGGSFLTKGTYEEITNACLEARKIVKENA